MDGWRRGWLLCGSRSLGRVQLKPPELQSVIVPPGASFDTRTFGGWLWFSRADARAAEQRSASTKLNGTFQEVFRVPDCGEGVSGAGALAGLGSSEQLSFLFVVVWKRKEQLSSGADFLTSLMRKPLSFGCSLSLTGPGLAVAVGLFLRPGQRSCGLEKAGRVLFMSVTGGWQCCPTGTV